MPSSTVLKCYHPCIYGTKSNEKWNPIQWFWKCLYSKLSCFISSNFSIIKVKVDRSVQILIVIPLSCSLTHSYRTEVQLLHLFWTFQVCHVVNDWEFTPKYDNNGGIPVCLIILIYWFFCVWWFLCSVMFFGVSLMFSFVINHFSSVSFLLPSVNLL